MKNGHKSRRAYSNNKKKKPLFNDLKKIELFNLKNIYILLKFHIK